MVFIDWCDRWSFNSWLAPQFASHFSFSWLGFHHFYTECHLCFNSTLYPFPLDAVSWLLAFYYENNLPFFYFDDHSNIIPFIFCVIFSFRSFHQQKHSNVVLKMPLWLTFLVNCIFSSLSMARISRRTKITEHTQAHGWGGRAEEFSGLSAVVVVFFPNQPWGEFTIIHNPVFPLRLW